MSQEGQPSDSACFALFAAFAFLDRECGVRVCPSVVLQSAPLRTTVELGILRRNDGGSVSAERWDVVARSLVDSHRPRRADLAGVAVPADGGSRVAGRHPHSGRAVIVAFARAG